MMRLLHLIRLGFLICAVSPLVADAKIGGTGWTPLAPNFKIQSPTNAPQSARYWITNDYQAFGVTNFVYHCMIYSNDGAFSVGNTTLPRTEHRFTPDYTSGQIQYESVLMCPSNENSYCCFQIHTGDAQSAQYGSTTFMAFWFTNYGGSLRYYSSTTLATNLGNKWFKLNCDHNLETGIIRVWINEQLVWTQQDNGAGDFYFKDGVYEQSHGPTLRMDTYIITNSIKMWVSSGTNPPAAPTGLAAAPTGTTIRLAWNTSVNATNYNLKRAMTNGGPYTTIRTSNTTSWTDSNVVAHVDYFYVVSAADQFGESSNSAIVTAALPPPPIINGVLRQGTNFVTSGLGGVTNGGYFVLASTNLAKPLNQWPRVATNAFDGAGNFSFTNAVEPSVPAAFYLLRLQ